MSQRRWMSFFIVWDDALLFGDRQLLSRCAVGKLFSAA